MKDTFLEKLHCPACSYTSLTLSIMQRDAREIRKGSVTCNYCNHVYSIENGILHFLYNPHTSALEERKACNQEAYLKLSDTEQYRINTDTITRFKDIFLALPGGNGSSLFSAGGCFQNQAENANRFFKTLDDLALHEGLEVLEIGSSFGWGASALAQRGCSVTALDINDYLITADLYFDHHGIFFNRILADMNKLPFKEKQFDLVFANTVLHHCVDLRSLYEELLKVLRPGGRLVALGECSLGLFEKRDNKALTVWAKQGYQEHAFRLHEWLREAKKAGATNVRCSFFSLVDDYIDRKKRRKAKKTWKLSLAYLAKRYYFLETLSNTFMLPWRIIFRPGSWKLEFSKK